MGKRTHKSEFEIEFSGGQMHADAFKKQKTKIGEACPSQSRHFCISENFGRANKKEPLYVAFFYWWYRWGEERTRVSSKMKTLTPYIKRSLSRFQSRSLMDSRLS